MKDRVLLVALTLLAFLLLGVGAGHTTTSVPVMASQVIIATSGQPAPGPEITVEPGPELWPTESSESTSESDDGDIWTTIFWVVVGIIVLKVLAAFRRRR